MTTTFIIPSINRPTLRRALESVRDNPVLYLIDKQRVGESEVRNHLIEQADTEWVSFLDDDDTVTSDYTERLEEEIAAHPEADLIHFRQYFLRGHILPSWPCVEFGNVGIAFSVKRELALKYPFVTQPHEDFHFVRTLQEAGYNIHFSKYLVYKVRH